MLNKIFFLLLLFSISNFLYCQPIEMLVGKNSIHIGNYYNNLFSKKQNPYYKTNSSTDKFGDLVLEASFSIYDQEYYKCLYIWTKFRRINGIEFCYMQTITGDIKYANSHLEYIKDNYADMGDGTWELPKEYENQPRRTVKFTKTDKYFTLVYEWDS